MGTTCKKIGATPPGAGLLVGRRGEKVEITPGMTATVEIITGSNIVLRYLVKPITKAANEALRAR